MSVRPVDSGDVVVSVDGAVVTATINRPSKRNALTQAMYGVLADTLEAADDDTGVAAVVLTGTGPAFTAGNDLGDFAAGEALVQTGRFLTAISSVDVPVVAAVNGVAVGVGVTMLLHCDLVYVEPSAALSVPFVSLGLVPEAASSLLLPRVVGERRASDLLLTGRRIDGTTAAAWGLANEAVSPALDAALAAAGRLAAMPPRALRSTKQLLRAEDSTVRTRMAAELEVFSAALRGREFAEVMAARSEGRPAAFPS
jgi:enoyl-CoA hydratase/carnithine racemase